jgi:NAD(P)-dependent dehydrogenase (short-subunit alcohol dehydrogenase family)
MNGKNLAGKVALITGAGGGIGKALAEELSERGCYLVLTDIDESLLRRTAATLAARDARFETHEADVSDAAQVERVVGGAFESLGRVDFLFNNAGINVFAEILDTSLEDWNRLIDVNLRGVIHGVHAAYPRMCKQGFGHIINVASVAGVVPAPAEGAYAATKHAVVGLSAALRIEAATHGVKVSVVCPGAVDTPILHASKHVKFDSDAIITLSPEKPMPPRQAARLILRGVQHNRFFIVMSKTAHAFWRVYRLAPEGTLSLGNLMMRRIRAIKRED